MSAPDPTPARVRFLTAGLLLGTFAAGAAFGAGLLVAMGPRPPPGTHGFGAGPPPPPGPLPLGDLGLSPTQDQEARKILERHRPALEAILRDSFPRVRVENEAIEREIRLILTDAQRQRLDQIKAARPPRPPPGTPGGPPFGPPPGPPGMGFPPPPPPPSPFDPPPK